MAQIGLYKIIGIIILIVITFFLVTWIFQWLWNTTMPEVFSLNKIDYWQAFKLLLIAIIFFGGISLSYKGLMY